MVAGGCDPGGGVFGAAGDTDALVGLVFGYEDLDNYWVVTRGSGKYRLRQCVNGVWSTVGSGSDSPSSSDWNLVAWKLIGEAAYFSPWHSKLIGASGGGGSGGPPVGRVGIYAEQVNAKFDFFRLTTEREQAETGHRLSNYHGDANSETRSIDPDESAYREADYDDDEADKDLVYMTAGRYDAFRAVFALRVEPSHSYAHVRFDFDVQDVANHDGLYIFLKENASAPKPERFVDGARQTWTADYRDSNAVPDLPSPVHGERMWFEFVSDGTTVTVKAQHGATQPSDASWAGVSKCFEDDGYDIADYRSINPAYGTMEDFRTFLAEAHRRRSLAPPAAGRLHLSFHGRGSSPLAPSICRVRAA